MSKKLLSLGTAVAVGLIWFVVLSMYPTQLVQLFYSEPDQQELAFKSGKEFDECDWVAIDVESRACYASPASLPYPPTESFFSLGNKSRMVSSALEAQKCEQFNQLESPLNEGVTVLSNHENTPVNVRWVCPIKVSTAGV